MSKTRRAARVTERPLRTGYKKLATKPEPVAKIGRYEATHLVGRFGAFITIASVVNAYIEDWAEGYAANSSGSAGRSPGTISRPTEAAVIAPDRPCRECGEDTPCPSHPQPGDAQIWARRSGEGLAAEAAEIIDVVEQIGTLIQRGLNHIERIAPLQPDIAHELAVQKKAHKIGAGACNCCLNVVTGAENDRLRSGYCMSCFKAWERAGRPADRAMFEVRRRVELATRRGDKPGDGETPGPSGEGEDGVQLSASGGEVRPGDSPYCEHIPPNLTDPDSFRCPSCAQ